MISGDIQWFQVISGDFRWFLWFLWFRVISGDFCWFLLISVDFRWFLWFQVISDDFCDFRWFQVISGDFCDFRWFHVISSDFRWFLWFQVISVISRDFSWFLVISRKGVRDFLEWFTPRRNIRWKNLHSPERHPSAQIRAFFYRFLPPSVNHPPHTQCFVSIFSILRWAPTLAPTQVMIYFPYAACLPGISQQRVVNMTVEIEPLFSNPFWWCFGVLHYFSRFSCSKSPFLQQIFSGNNLPGHWKFLHDQEKAPASASAPAPASVPEFLCMPPPPWFS